MTRDGSKRAWRVRSALCALVALAAGGCSWVSRMSLSSSGAESNADSFGAVLSADGRYVAFESLASNLVSDDTNGAQDVFVRDTVTGTTSRVSVDSEEAQANDRSFLPAISADGRYVGFMSMATNLGAAPNAWQVFVRDTVEGTTTLVSVDNNGVKGSGGNSTVPALSADGRYVAFRVGRTEPGSG